MTISIINFAKFNTAQILLTKITNNILLNWKLELSDVKQFIYSLNFKALSRNLVRLR